MHGLRRFMPASGFAAGHSAPLFQTIKIWIFFDIYSLFLPVILVTFAFKTDIMGRIFRELTGSEIEIMTAAGCRSDDWSAIRVADGFRADRVCRVAFSGRVTLGANGGTVTDGCGVVRPSGVYDAALIDVTVGDDAFVSRIGSYVSGYDIGDGAVVENTDRLVYTGNAAFGCGVRAAAVNENGGRAVTLSEGLGAQTAYLQAMYRHRPGLAPAIEALAARPQGRGGVGPGAKISGCGVIRDVKVGENAVIEGAALLADGTVGRDSYIGAGVSAEGFVCAPGAKVRDGVSLERCFVGQGCVLEKGFTAVDSLFFANSHMACGEAVSVFAGPYSVSHHKSSLLIAGYFLFFNAGSGSNQSNHLFKTGPVHQGVHERGCKFGSNAYVMLPAREGVFTTVMGRHTSHHDTSDMPFSYLTEEDGKTFLHPGAALRSYGLGRDVAKWPKRDNRTGEPLDLVHFDLYNPYVGMRLRNAVEICRTLLERKSAETYMWNRIRIRKTLLERGLALYTKALDATLGTILAAGCGKEAAPCVRWVDMAGMFAPADGVEALCDRIEAGEFRDMGSLNAALRGMYDSYRDNAYAWALDALASSLGRQPSSEDIARAAEAGCKAHEELTAMQAEDGRRDDADLMATGYGMDATTEQQIRNDFENVRKR